jgi:hypothetical protein
VLRSIASNSLYLGSLSPPEAAELLGRLGARLAALDDRGWSFCPVPVVLRDVPEVAFFDTIAEAVFDAVAPRLADFEPEDASRPPGDLGFRRLSRNLRTVVAELQRRSRRQVKLVLLIDGIEQLNRYRPQVNQKLRSLFMAGLGEHLVAVAAGGEIDRSWEREGSPWFNFFEEIDATAMTVERE